MSEVNLQRVTEPWRRQLSDCVVVDVKNARYRFFDVNTGGILMTLSPTEIKILQEFVCDMNQTDDPNIGFLKLLKAIEKNATD